MTTGYGKKWLCDKLQQIFKIQTNEYDNNGKRENQTSPTK